MTSKLDTRLCRVEGIEQTIFSIQRTQECQENEINILKNVIKWCPKDSIFDEKDDRERRKTNLIVLGIERDEEKIKLLFQRLTAWRITWL